MYHSSFTNTHTNIWVLSQKATWLGEGLSEEVLQLVGVHEREEGEVGGVQNAVLEEEGVPLRSALFLGQKAEYPLKMAKQ